MRRLFAILLLALAVLPSWAAVPKVGGYWYFYGSPANGSADFNVACQFAAVNQGPGSYFHGIFGTPPNQGCQFMYGDGRGPFTAAMQAEYRLICPAGTVENSAGTCDVSDTACAPKSGTSNLVNVTAGWKRTPKVGDATEEWVHTYKLPNGGQANICTSGCQQSIDAAEPCDDCKSYVSQTPGTNGMYRVSVDFRGHYSGKACTDADSQVPQEQLKADDSKDPACPGYVGEVNGVKGCFGTADKPVRPVSGVTLGYESAAGNPAAGDKPEAGGGSGSGGTGRTPSSGTGGSAGGPSSAAVASGSSPSGTVNKPGEGKEQANCGAPGQPKCGIDETGTPRAEKNQFDNAADKYKTDMDSNREKISGASDKGFFEGWRSFWWAPPVVACQPFTLPSILGLALPSVDACAVVEGVRAVMGVLWALAGFIFCMRIVALTIRGN